MQPWRGRCPLSGVNADTETYIHTYIHTYRAYPKRVHHLDNAPYGEMSGMSRGYKGLGFQARAAKVWATPRVWLFGFRVPLDVFLQI